MGLNGCCTGGDRDVADKGVCAEVVGKNGGRCCREADIRNV